MNLPQITRFGNKASGLSSAGTTQATATACPADFSSFSTVTEGQGCILSAGNAEEVRVVVNAGSAAGLIVYPPVGSAFNGAAANAGQTIPTKRAAFFIFLNATTIISIAGA